VVYVSNRQIVISGAAGKRYDIYTADGRTFRSATAAATEAVDATPGVYLVRVAAQTVKVIVK
jgi:predicted transcriptional regulator